MSWSSRSNILPADTKADIERRLNETHRERVNSLSTALKSTMQIAFKGAATRYSGASVQSKRQDERMHDFIKHLVHTDQRQQGGSLSDPMNIQQRIASINAPYTQPEASMSYDRSPRSNSFTMQQPLEPVRSLSLGMADQEACQQQLDALRAQLDHMQNELRQAMDGKNSAEKQAAVAETTARIAQDTAHTRLQEIHELQRQFQAVMEQKQHEVDTLRAQLEQHSSGLQHHEQMRLEQERELRNALVNAQLAHQELNTKMQRLATKQDESESETQQLKKSNHELQSTNQKLLADVREAQTLLLSSDQERKDMRARYVALAERMDGLLGTEGKLKEALAKTARELKAATAEKEQMKSQLQESNSRYQEEYLARRRAERKQGKLMSFSSKDAEELRQELVALQSQLTDSRCAEQQMEALRVEIKTLTANLKSQEELLAAAKHDLTRETELRREAEFRGQAMERARKEQPPALAGSSSHSDGLGLSPRSVGDMMLRAEHLQILNTKLSAMQQDLARDYQQRVEAVEQDWRVRLKEKNAELETHVQQTEARLQMELMKGAEASKDCSQLRAWLQEAKAANHALAMRADDADQLVNQLRKHANGTAAQLIDIGRALGMERMKLTDMSSRVRELTVEPAGSARHSYLLNIIEDQLKGAELRIQRLYSICTSGEGTFGPDFLQGPQAVHHNYDWHALDPLTSSRSAPGASPPITSRSEVVSAVRIEELRKAHCEAQEQLDKAKAEFSRCEAELASLKKDKSQLQQEKDDLAAKHSACEDKLSKVEGEQKELHAKYQALEKHSGQLEEMVAEGSREMSRLHQELTCANQNKLVLERELQAMEQNNLNLQQQLQDLGCTKEGLGAEHNRLVEQIKRLEEYKGQLTETAQGWENEKSALQERVRELQQAVHAQANKLAQMSALEMRVEELQATTSDSQHLSRELESTRNGLLLELERQGREVQDAQEQLVQAQQLIAHLQEQSALSDKRADVVQAETISVLRMTLKQLQALLHNSVSGLRICQEALKHSFKQEMNHALQTCQQMLKQAHDRFSASQAALEEDLTDKVHQARAECMESAEKISDLESQLQTFKNHQTQAMTVLQQVMAAHLRKAAGVSMSNDWGAVEDPSSGDDAATPALIRCVADIKVGVECLALKLNQEQHARAAAVAAQHTVGEELCAVAGMRDALVSALGHELNLPVPLQQELRSEDRMAFQHGLQELCEVVWRQGQVAGVCTALSTETRVLQQQLAQREEVIRALEQRLDAASSAYKRSLQHWKASCMASASKAFKIGLKPLCDEVEAIRASVVDLSSLHDIDMDDLQHEADVMLKDQRSLALRALSDMENTAVSLQAALSNQHEKSEQLVERVVELQADKERQAQVEQRRIQRQAEEVDALTDRIRALESREIEKDGQLKQLRRSNMQSQRSLIDSQPSMDYRMRESLDAGTMHTSSASEEMAMQPRHISPTSSRQTSGGPKTTRVGSDVKGDW